ncbi:MAG: 4-hydroxy-3-methylbut-2-enyl diphosphate reductase [Verrucomicrobiia bacterium]|jgi:4-hydroxy-3-methylbut-2-enyl diphosphate reductase
MRILRANHLGMCFGVKNAINLANKVSNETKLTILGELVHNNYVLDSLKKKGVDFANTRDEIKNHTVMITAHGISDRAISALRASGFAVIEATCPLVKYVHKTVKQLVNNGYHPVVVGRKDHTEVRGIVGDLEEYDVILTPDDIPGLKERKKFGVVSQTTQPIALVNELVNLLKKRFPNSEVCFIDTVCAPTKLRQTSAINLALQSDVVIVIGGRKSNNTMQLVRTCSRYCQRVYHVENADELLPEWFFNAQTVGITAGTSTPDDLIDSVEEKILSLVKALEPLHKPVAAGV